jgi:hypothetical protein
MISKLFELKTKQKWLVKQVKWLFLAIFCLVFYTDNFLPSICKWMQRYENRLRCSSKSKEQIPMGTRRDLMGNLPNWPRPFLHDWICLCLAIKVLETFLTHQNDCNGHIYVRFMKQPKNG